MKGMAEANAHRKILVIDDHYGVASDDFYGRADFERDYGSLPFDFVFSSAWDEESGRYTVEAARLSVEEHKPDGVLLDIVFDQQGPAGQLGLAILRELTTCFPALPVVMMTVLARDEVWKECARLGAVDYLPKPLDARLLALTLDRYVGVGPEQWLIGQNRQFVEALTLAALAAEGGQTPVMITGETGTGKGLLARFVHRHGRRFGKPFELIDLPNIPAEMQTANLFGYRRGAFTGADRDEPGRFVKADTGTVFLDEIGEIDESTQLRLLRVADGGEVSRLGDGKTARVDVQLVTATNADLPHKIKNRQFRYDLWARLSGMPVNLPPLAQRRDDIPSLVRHLLRCQALLRHAPVPSLPEHIQASLMEFPWEGNVRGLRNYAQRVFDLAGSNTPGESHFLAALPVRAGGAATLAAATVPLQGQGSETGLPIGGFGSPDTTIGFSDLPGEIARLRLEEITLLQRALDLTRDPVNRTANRAKAAALLKGKAKCSTNEFDRWLNNLAGQLPPANRQSAAIRFPELTYALVPPTGQGD